MLKTLLNLNICVCPDFMTCEEEKESFAMEKEQMLHLIYGCGFVVFFIVLISEYFVNLSKCIRRYQSGVSLQVRVILSESLE